MFCEKCGASLREGAKFCPECGLMTEDALSQPITEYSYETIQNLYPWQAVVPIILLLWLPFTAIGVMVSITEGFWFVSVIMSGIVLFAIFALAWAYKGKRKKWGIERILWILTPEGFASGYPPDVVKRLTLLGVTSADATIGGQNWNATSPGITKNTTTVIKGLPVLPWTEFISAEYRPEKREIALHLPTGLTRIIYTNPDNYTYVEQLVRGYMGRR